MNNKKLAIIAGKGELVQNLIYKSQKADFDLIVISIDNPELNYNNNYKLYKLNKIDINYIFKILKREKISQICMAGYVKRPDRLLDFLNPFSIMLLLRFRNILNRGDAALFRLFNAYIEKKGFKIIGASEINPELTLSEGVYSRRNIPKHEIENIELAKEKMRIFRHHDIGQAAVVSKGRFIAVEAAEGTDAMLSRVVELNCNKKKINGIFIKTSQMEQDLRTDMPTIGKKTIDLVIKSKLSGLVITAGDVIVLDYETIIKMIDENNLFFAVIKNIQ
jgi:DUF1009 family protein